MLAALALVVTLCGLQATPNKDGCNVSEIALMRQAR
ncbi:Uncharacterised protein [Mycobacteroides abscessus]|nr:Uncharacterised protein [Mycobacteroides abscessus]